MKTELKTIYETILELDKKIYSLLTNFPEKDFDDFNNKLQKFLDEKEVFVQKVVFFKENSQEEFRKLKDANFKEISEQINELEEENLEIIKNNKTVLSKKINVSNKTLKALSAYKYKKPIKPRIIDESD